MEKKLYTIGKVAKLMGMQSQLLRHYCDIGLITPEYVDPQTGYRYFSFEQLPDIDRTRFLLRCGLRLKEIKQVLQEDNLPLLVELLDKEREQRQLELQRAQDGIDLIDWYINYFTFNKQPASAAPYQIRRIEERFLLAARCPEDYQPTGLYQLFSRIKNAPRYRNLKLTRQVTVVLDYEALLEKRFKRLYVGAFLIGDPGFRAPEILRIPAGEYYCFRANIHDEDWNPSQLRIPLADKVKPVLTLASEYEATFSTYNNNPHELQILFGDPILEPHKEPPAFKGGDR